MDIYAFIVYKMLKWFIFYSF